MILTIAKVIADVIAIFVLAKTFNDFRKKKESYIMLLFWSAIWWGVIIVSLFPEMIDQVFGQGRAGVNTFMGLIIVFLLYLSYRIYLKADRNERELQRIVKELAIKLPEDD